MTEITKQLAREIASKMLAEKKEKLKSLMSEYEKTIVERCNSLTPDYITEFYTERPPYINCNSRITLNGEPIAWYNCFSDSKPINIYDRTFGATIKDLKGNIEAKIELLREVEMRLSPIIFEFKTFESLKENFPEAAKHLPEEKSVLLLKLSDVMDKFKQI